MPDIDIQVPDDMICELGNLYDDAGEILGPAFDAAGNMLEDIDLGAIWEGLGDNLHDVVDAAGVMVENIDRKSVVRERVSDVV